MKKIILGMTLMLLIGAVYLIPFVKVNYDMKAYLPKDHPFVLGYELNNELFGTSSEIILTIYDQPIDDVLLIKDELLLETEAISIDAIDRYLNQATYEQFLFHLDATTRDLITTQMDTMMENMSFETSFYQLLTMMPEAQVAMITEPISFYIHQNDHYVSIIYPFSSSDEIFHDVIIDLKTRLDAASLDYTLLGSPIAENYMQETIENEVLNITLWIIPLVLVVLLLMTPSLADLLVFGGISTVAILINLGSNAFFPNISFITQSMAIALQLAISLDYAIFLLHQYHQERKDLDQDLALKKTMKKVTIPIIASSLTTAVSFFALTFMDFSIGKDIGFVFLKGVLLSAASTLILGPILISYADQWMMRSTHKVFIPKFQRISKMIYRFRWALLMIMMLMFVPAYLMQSNNAFLYGESGLISSEGSTYQLDLEKMNASFGHRQTIILLIDDDSQKEAALYQAIMTDDMIQTIKIDAWYTYESTITDENILQMIRPNFVSNDMRRMVITLDMKEESPETFDMIDRLLTHVEDQSFEYYYIIGSSQAAYVLKEIIETDYQLVILIAIIAVMLVILILYKNIFIPILLTFVILGSVFTAMSIPYLSQNSLSFLGYLVVSAILLGATIDYAILFSKRYTDLRLTHQKHQAMSLAIEETAPSILTSALIFAIAGFAVGIISSIQAISDIGLLILYGAILGFIYVIFLLPQLLFISDKWISKKH